MNARHFLKEIDYFNTNVEGEIYEELGIATLSDILELYHQAKLKSLGITDVSNSKYPEECPECGADEVFLQPYDDELFICENCRITLPYGC